MVKELKIPYGRQNVTEEDIRSVERVLRSDFLTQGPEVPNFESNFSNYVGSKYSVAVNSATSALHLACLALDLKKGEKLWTSAVTFVASANCALYCGAQVDLIDIDKSTSNLSIEALEKKLIQAKKNDSLPKIIIPVHLSGLSCDMKKIKKLSKQYGFKIIEDASHASGGIYDDSKIGSCRYSDLSVFSFHPVKNFTSGEGGMVSTNSEDIYRKIKLLREHGINKESEKMIFEPDGPWYYEQIYLGYNYRMTDISAALGNSQLKRLDLIAKKRNEIAEFYNYQFKDSPLDLPYQDTKNISGRHLYVIRLKNKDIQRSHKEVFYFLREKGIGVNLHYIPIYRHPFYEKFNFDKNMYPNSESYYNSAISIPMYPELTENELSYVVKSVKEAIA